MSRTGLLLITTWLAMGTQPLAWAQDTTIPTAEDGTSDAAPFEATVPTLTDPDAVSPPAPYENSKVTERTTLLQALEITYNNNPTIKAQRKSLAATDEQMPQALSGFLPTAIADYSKGRQRAEFNGGPTESNRTEVRQLTVTEPLFRGFRTWNSISRADNLIESARGELKSTEQQVLLNGVIAYMNVVRDRAVLELSKNNENVLKKQLQASRDRFDVGEITRTDVAQSESRLSRSTSDRIQAEGTLVASIANYERVVGVQPGELQVPAASPELPGTLEVAIDEGLKYNPQIIAVDKRQEAAEDDVAIQKGVLLPEVSLQGAMTRQEGGGLLGDSEFDEDTLTLNARIPLYQSGAEYSRVRQAKAVASQRKYEFRDQQDRVSEQVTQSWENVKTTEATIRSQQDAIRAAQIALDGVRQEQLYGARTILDVLDAEQELFVANVNLVRAQRDYWVSVYNLKAAVGHLTLEDLGMEGKNYDPEDHYDDVKYQFIGF